MANTEITTVIPISMSQVIIAIIAAGLAFWLPYLFVVKVVKLTIPKRFNIVLILLAMMLPLLYVSYAQRYDVSMNYTYLLGYLVFWGLSVGILGKSED